MTNDTLLPTLSKQTAFILPQTLILRGLIQYMSLFFIRDWANTIPTVRAAGRAGGTAIVITSRLRFIISPTGSPLWTWKVVKKNLNLQERSFSNLDQYHWRQWVYESFDSDKTLRDKSTTKVCIIFNHVVLYHYTFAISSFEIS